MKGSKLMDRKTRVELTNLCIVYNEDKILVQEKIVGDKKGIVFPGGQLGGVLENILKLILCGLVILF